MEALDRRRRAARLAAARDGDRENIGRLERARVGERVARV